MSDPQEVYSDTEEPWCGPSPQPPGPGPSEASLGSSRICRSNAFARKRLRSEGRRNAGDVPCASDQAVAANRRTLDRLAESAGLPPLRDPSTERLPLNPAGSLLNTSFRPESAAIKVRDSQVKLGTSARSFQISSLPLTSLISTHSSGACVYVSWKKEAWAQQGACSSSMCDRVRGCWHLHYPPRIDDTCTSRLRAGSHKLQQSCGVHGGSGHTWTFR